MERHGHRFLEAVLKDAVSRLTINFFRPSFKIKSKTRDGARVHKTYHPPITPCDRLLGLPPVADETKVRLREQSAALDPVRLLQEICAAQHTLVGFAASGRPETPALLPVTDVATFLSNLSTAWVSGEVRPTHRQQPGATHGWRSRTDLFAHSWPVVHQWIERESTVTASEIVGRLAVRER